MTDVFSKAKRSEVMALIRSHGNKGTEIKFLKLLRHHQITGWRRHLPLSLEQATPGGSHGEKRRPQVKPDFVFRGPRVAVFIDGCFWHGCPTHGTKPQTRAEFWRGKLTENRARDRRVTRALRAQGWRVLRIWEHQLSEESRLMEQVKRSIE